MANVSYNSALLSTIKEVYYLYAVRFGYRCQPGTQFTEGCKTCWCSSDGLTSNCKPDTCPPEVSRQKRGIEYALRCDPGEIFRRDCNTCICSVDGIADHASCTIHQCRRHKRRVTGIAEAHDVAVQMCEPGKNFQKDCNTCLCSSDGTEAFCTLMACPPPSHLRERLNDSRRCKPGSFYKKRCNLCRCSEDGKTEVCTLKACRSEILALLHVRRGDK